MITTGKELIFNKDDEDDGEKVSLRVLQDYIHQKDIMIARFDILTYKDNAPYKQFNCGIEIKNNPLIKPHGIEGFSTIISKSVLINIFEGFVKALKEET